MEEVVKIPMRKLKADDIFPMTSLISKLGLREMAQEFSERHIIKCMTDENRETLIQELGAKVVINLATTVLSNLDKCKQEIYQLLSNVTGLAKEEIAELELETFTELIFDFFKKEEFKGFIKVVSKFLK